MPLTPVELLQAAGRPCVGPQSQAGEEHQDRVMAPVLGRSPRVRGEDALPRLGRQARWEGWQAAPGAGGGPAASQPGRRSPPNPRTRRRARTATPGICRPPPWFVAASGRPHVAIAWAGQALHVTGPAPKPGLRNRWAMRRERGRGRAAAPQTCCAVERVPDQPVVRCRGRGARGQEGVLPSAPEPRGEARSGWGPSARRRPLQPANRALDARFIPLGHGVPLVGQPPTERSAGA